MISLLKLITIYYRTSRTNAVLMYTVYTANGSFMFEWKITFFVIALSILYSFFFQYLLEYEEPIKSWNNGMAFEAVNWLPPYLF